MNTILSLDNISYSYQTPKGETAALSDITFSISLGEFVAIVGPSGCGKSTLLSIISGMLKPDTGSIYTKPMSSIGYMLQRDNLLEWRTIYDNACLGLEIQKQLTPSNKEKVNNLLSQYGLSAFCKSKPSQLSGGMRQRAALIRTLALDPDILLLDEPFSALDYQTRLEVSDDIARIIKEQQKTALLVTHDIGEAISMADKVIILSHRPGTVKTILPIEMNLKDRTPLSVRSTSEFSAYYNYIWEELQ